MSKNINVNPAHYKVAGRERQGEDIAQHLQKQAFGQQRAEVERWQARHGQGAPGWENPAQPTAEPEPEPAPAPARPKRARKAKPRRKPARARKPAASRTMAKKGRTLAKKGRKSATARRAVKRPRRPQSTRTRRPR